VEHRKRCGFFGHEYLVMTLVYTTLTNFTYTRYIKLERGVKRSDAFSDFTASLLTSGSAVTPLDVISISPAAFEVNGSYSLRYLQFPSRSQPTILDVAAVLKAVQEKAPSYELYNHMCYWFAGAVFEGLGFLCHGHIERGEKPKQCGRFLGIVKISRTAVALEAHSEPGCFDCPPSGMTDIPTHITEFRECL